MRELLTVGVLQSEVTKLCEILALLEGKTREPWRYRISSHPSAVMLDPFAAQASGALAGLLQDGKTVPIYITGTGQCWETTGSTRQPLRIETPLRVANVMEVLDAASERLRLASRSTLAASLFAVVSAPGNGFRYQLQLGSDVQLILLPELGVYHATNTFELSAAMLALSPSVMSMSGAELQHELGAARPLEELLWSVGTQHTEALLPWIEADSRYALGRWPSVAALRSTPTWPHLAALWFAAPSSIDALLATGAAPRGELVAFVNGCVLCGYAKASPLAGAPQAASLSARRDPRFTKIRNKLGIPSVPRV